MDFREVLTERRSCRNFSSQPLETEKIQFILQAGAWAPSVMNLQPWKFIVITNPSVKQKIKESAEEALQLAYQRSGWKWLSRFSVNFITQAPVIIAVTADPRDTGADQFLLERGRGYEYSCCAAIQNMLLAAHSIGVASLWYSLFQKDAMKELLNIPPELDLISMVILGYAAEPSKPVPRKTVAELTSWIE